MLRNFAFFVIIGIVACQSESYRAVSVAYDRLPYQSLSEYGFFTGQINELTPNEGVLPYELSSSLFTDYAHKKRFIYHPNDVSSTTDSNGRVVFSDRTVLIKNFYYPADFSQPTEHWDIIETRLMVNNGGSWQAYTYVWDDNQKDATLSNVGGYRDVSWINESGDRQATQYQIPNKNQCKGCHNIGDKLEPIGPKLANLDKEISIGDQQINQLDYWVSHGVLQESSYASKRFVNYEMTHYPIEDRAKSYLDINCGHCHSKSGPAHTSGLFLQYENVDPISLGICKTPVAAGKGSGGRTFGITPGDAAQSILHYRMNSVDPGVMMPELGRSMIHIEGVDLIANWINQLSGDCNTQTL